jgi:arabinogalactan oligomer/maltooligosaccharide transport system substrate-binding protein
MRQILCVVCVALLLLTQLSLAAAAAPAEDAITLVFWHTYSDDQALEVQDVVTEYEATHPGVQVELVQKEFGPMKEEFDLAVPQGLGPDVAVFDGFALGDEAVRGNILPLEFFGVSEAFMEGIYELHSVADMIVAGWIWGLPLHQEAIALVYNKALVDETYLPADNQDFDGLLAKIEGYKDNTGKDLLCNQAFGSLDSYHAAPVFFGYGVPAFIDDLAQVHVNTPEAIAAGEWILSVNEFIDDDMDYTGCQDRFYNGEVGIWWTGPWAMAGIEAQAVPVDYGIQPMGKPFLNTHAMTLTPNAVNRGLAPQALDFMLYYTNYTSSKALALANKTIPANTAALMDPQVQALTSVAGFGEAYRAGVNVTNHAFIGCQWTPMNQAVLDIWQEVATPAVALAQAEQEIEACLSGFEAELLPGRVFLPSLAK